MKGGRGRCESRGLMSERSREQPRGERPRHASRERETRGERERERHVVEKEREHTRVQRGWVCLLYRGTRRFEKE